MKPIQLIAVALIALSALALAYGGFTYTKETHETNVGPLNLSIEDRQWVNVPVWAGAGGLIIGGVLLLFGRPIR